MLSDNRRCNAIFANPNRPVLLVDDGVGFAGEKAGDFGATTIDDGGFINTEEVRANGVPLCRYCVEFFQNGPQCGNFIM